MEVFSINHQGILSAVVCILVAITLLVAMLFIGSLWSAYNPDTIAAVQMFVLAFGLSAMALAILRLSYKSS
jgi:ABC-type antimicrobial peptide transport system permease subunit